MFAFLTSMGVGLFALVNLRFSEVQLEIDRTKAFYLAEAAISLSINSLKHSGTGSVGPVTLADGSEYRASVSGGIVTGIGKVAGITKELEVTFSS
ncbi:MAG: hypothetical protein PHQ61_06470 [Candidatus Omnitrophica bacterium]|nr:hypothetical protein [Candidatus Omnitrophota bacterium]